MEFRFNRGILIASECALCSWLTLTTLPIWPHLVTKVLRTQRKVF